MRGWESGPSAGHPQESVTIMVITVMFSKASTVGILSLRW